MDKKKLANDSNLRIFAETFFKNSKLLSLLILPNFRMPKVKETQNKIKGKKNDVIHLQLFEYHWIIGCPAFNLPCTAFMQ